MKHFPIETEKKVCQYRKQKNLFLFLIYLNSIFSFFSRNLIVILECWLPIGCIELSDIGFGNAIKFGNF